MFRAPGDGEDLIEVASASFPPQSLNAALDDTRGVHDAPQPVESLPRGRSSRTKDIGRRRTSDLPVRGYGKGLEGRTQLPCVDGSSSSGRFALDLNLIADSDEEEDTQRLPRSRACWQRTRSEHSRHQPEGGYVEDAISSELELDEEDATGADRFVDEECGPASRCWLPFARHPSNVGMHSCQSAGFLGKTSAWVHGHSANRTLADPDLAGVSQRSFKGGLYVDRRVSVAKNRHGRSFSESAAAFLLAGSASSVGLEQIGEARCNGRGSEVLDLPRLYLLQAGGSAKPLTQIDLETSSWAQDRAALAHKGSETLLREYAMDAGRVSPCAVSIGLQLDDSSRLVTPVDGAFDNHSTATTQPFTERAEEDDGHWTSCDADLTFSTPLSDSCSFSAVATAAADPSAISAYAAAASDDLDNSAATPKLPRTVTSSPHSEVRSKPEAGSAATATASHCGGHLPCFGRYPKLGHAAGARGKALSPVEEALLDAIPGTLKPGSPMADAKAKRLQAIRQLARFCGETFGRGRQHDTSSSPSPSQPYADGVPDETGGDDDAGDASSLRSAIHADQEVTATPAASFPFSSWSLDIGGGETNRSITARATAPLRAEGCHQLEAVPEPDKSPPHRRCVSDGSARPSIGEPLRSKGLGRLRSHSLISLDSTAGHSAAAPEAEVTMIDTMGSYECEAPGEARAESVLRDLLEQGRGQHSPQRRPRSSSGSLAPSFSDVGRRELPPLSKRLKWRGGNLLRLLPIRMAAGSQDADAEAEAAMML